ncbi:MAG: hypothetical protein K8R88_02760 [Armatimonadetes bacterium]|nr:hypothetical protein [Armatimonadota bacterium]
MDTTEWHEAFVRMRENLETIRNWQPEEPCIEAQRCEYSRHRTLAHLRACQEQWLWIVLNFIENESPSIKIPHPWRIFDDENYEIVSWENHMEKFIADRVKWLALRDIVGRDRGGKWNSKLDTISGLTRRLVDHESHHIGTLRTPTS